MLPATYNTIKVRSFLKIQDEFTATAAVIKPGMLLQFHTDGKVKAHATANGDVTSKMFALEDELQGKEISNAYDASAKIQVWTATSGDYVYALLADGESVQIGDALESNGDGYLRKHVADSYKFGDSSHTDTIYTSPIVGIAMETLDLSSSSGLESSALQGAQRILVKII